MIGTIVAAALWALAASLLLSVLIGAVVAGVIVFTRPAAATRQALWSLALAAAGFAPVAILAVMLVRGTLMGNTGDRVRPMTLPASVHSATKAQPHAVSAATAIAPHPAGGLAVHVFSLPSIAPIAGEAVVAIWALGALIGLAGLARSLVRVRGLKLRSNPLDGTLATELPWLTTTSGREIYLRLSFETETPIAVGFRRPVILLPTEMATADGLTSIEPLIMHEYAHLARYDDWSNLAQRATERLFWFNPLVWILGRRIALEREVAADEAVIARTHDAKNYASTLWRMAQEMRMPEHVVVAPGAMLTRKQISVRIERLLEENPMRGRHVGAAAFAIVILTATGVAGLAATAPAIDLTQAAPAVEHASPVAKLVKLPPAHPVVAVEPPPAPMPPAVHPNPAPVSTWTVTNVRPEPRRESDEAGSGQALAQTVTTTVERALHKHGIAVAFDPSSELSRDIVRSCMGCDFSKHDLSGLDLSDISISGDDFTNAKLVDVNFSRSVLQGLDFTRANLTNANFHGARLTGVDLSHADLRNANLSNAILTGVDLSHADLSNANTTNIHLIGSSLP